MMSSHLPLSAYLSATTAATGAVAKTLCTTLCSACVMTGPVRVGAIAQRLSWSIRSWYFLAVLVALAML